MTRSRQILFVQGGGAGAHDEWDDKLAESLRRELGGEHEVRYPRMPDEGDPSYARWSAAIRREMADPDDGAVVAGHSVGAAILVSALAEQPPERGLEAIVLIAAPFVGDGGWPATTRPASGHGGSSHEGTAPGYRRSGRSYPEKANMTQPAIPDSPDWQRRWTIDADSVSLQRVTRRIAQAVLDGGPITRKFESGALHDRIPQAMGFAILHIDSGAAAVLPTVWLVTRRADGQILGDIGTHGPPDSEGCVEIGHSLAPSARGKGIGTAAVAALVGRLAAIPRIRRLTAVTSAQNAASRRVRERQGFRITGPLPGTDEVRYILTLS